MAFLNGKEVELRLVNESGGGGSYKAGDNIKIDDDGTISVITTDNAIRDNTRPITSAGVYNIVGNIEALLETI